MNMPTAFDTNWQRMVTTSTLKRMGYGRSFRQCQRRGSRRNRRW